MDVTLLSSLSLLLILILILPFLLSLLSLLLQFLCYFHITIVIVIAIIIIITVFVTTFLSISSINEFYLLSLPRGHNENKDLPFLCYCHHFVFSPTLRKRCYSFSIGSVVFSRFIYLFFFCLFVFNQELTIPLHFLLYNFVYLFINDEI